MKQGFIKIHRKLLTWEWYSDANVCRLFLHLLLTAKFKDEKWRGSEIKRGQILCGRIELAKSTGLTQQQIRTALNKLKSTNEITIKTTNRFSIITLRNYELYQSKNDMDNQRNNHQDNQQITNNQPTDNQQITTVIRNKEIQELKRKEEEKPLADQFEKFWVSYVPIRTKDGFVKKGGKEKAQIAFKKALRETPFEKIMTALESYLTYCQRNQRFTKGVAAWLNEGDFDLIDESCIIANGGKQSNQQLYNNLMTKYENE